MMKLRMFFYNSPAGTVQETTYTETKGSSTWGCAEASDYQTLLDNNQVITGNGYGVQTYKVSNANGRKWRVLGVDGITGELYAYCGMYFVSATGFVDGHSMYDSFGFVSTPSCGVRPVVTLKLDIQLQSTSIENGITTYNIKN